MLQNNLQVLPFYDSIEKQNHRRPYAFGQVFPLIASTKHLLPFRFSQIGNAMDEPVAYSVNLVYLGTGVKVSIYEYFEKFRKYYESEDRAVIVWPENAKLNKPFTPGLAYIEVEAFDDITYVSEVFSLVDDTSEYIELKWWDEDTPDFVNVLYIDSIVGKPKYDFDEEGEERDGYFFAEKQVSKKTYRFSFVAPEYLCDALRVVRMADHVQITFNSDTLACDSFQVDVEWEDQGDLAEVDAEFIAGTVIKKIAAGWPK